MRSLNGAFGPVAALLAFAGACGGPDVSPSATSGGELDEASVMAMAAAYTSLTKVNASPFRSMAGQTPHLADPEVDVYVNGIAEGAFLLVDPASSSAAGPLAEGALIVKDNLADPPFLTVMYKAPVGYDVDHGDWWYGRLHRDGRGAGYTGRVGFCIDCHGRRAAQDYLFGVSPADR